MTPAFYFVLGIKFVFVSFMIGVGATACFENARARQGFAKYAMNTLGAILYAIPVISGFVLTTSLGA